MGPPRHGHHYGTKKLAVDSLELIYGLPIDSKITKTEHGHDETFPIL